MFFFKGFANFFFWLIKISMKIITTQYNFTVEIIRWLKKYYRNLKLNFPNGNQSYLLKRQTTKLG